MKKTRIFIFLILIMLMTGCMIDGSQDEVSGDIVNAGDIVSENQMDGLGEEQSESLIESQPDNQAENLQSGQMEDSEIVCENPYFFPQNISFMTAEITYIRIGEAGTIVELELRWLKQYDKGCLAKLSIVPFDDMPSYMDEARLNTYFYVTANEIYQISPYIVQNDELITFNNDDTLLMSVLDTDEKLIENGELVSCSEDIEDQLEEGEVGTHISIEQQGNQIFCNRVDIRENGDPDYYENYIWEEGTGLVGYLSGYDVEVRDRGEIVYLKNIMYGTTDQAEDKDIVCTNPYFFPQNVSSLTADLTYEDQFEYGGPTTKSNELELLWLKQYDDGCLVRLSVAPFDNVPDYMDMTYFNFYFYVTSDEIYRIHFHVASEYFNSYYDGLLEDSEKIYFYRTSYASAGRTFDNMDVYIEHNDNLIMAVLNTDEKLMEYGELVCSLERILNDVEEGEGGTYLSMRQEGGQVIYDRACSTEYNLNDWEHYYWENERGLVAYRRGFRAERDPFYIENIVAE